MYATQEARPHTQPGVNITSTPPAVPTLAAPTEYSHAYSGYSTGDGYSYENSNYQSYNYGYPQQGNPPHSQHMGGYENSTAPYQPVNSYTDSTHYQGSSNYYNAPVPSYQNPGTYQQVNYSNQWNVNNYGNYAGYPGYPGYPQQDPTNTGQAVNNQYTQDYQQQWANYYASLPQPAPKVEDPDDCTAPGTEPAAAEKKSLPYNQPPPPGTGWDLNEPSYPEANPSQAGTACPPENGGAFIGNPSVAFHGDQYSHVQPNHLQQPTYVQHNAQDQPLHFQSPLDQHTLIQGQQLATAQSHMPANNFQPKVYQSPITDLSQRRVGKVQIPTNPRIVSTMSMNTKAVPTDLNQPRKPAYMSVPVKTSPFKVSTDMTSDAMLQPGMFPPSLRAYVERALSRCKDEAQKKLCQEIMKEMITTASADGSLFTKNWDTEPLFPLPNVASSSGKDILQSLNVVSPFSKQDRSPTKRLKSRWEPIAEAKLDDKSDTKGSVPKKDFSLNFSRIPETSVSTLKWEKQDNIWNKPKALLQQQFTSMNNSGQRAAKKARKDGLGEVHDVNNSSEDSEADIIPVGGVCLGTLTTTETPEEKLRRQSRTKRFDKSKDGKTGNKDLLRGKMNIGGSASARRATALRLAKSAGDGSGSAVEDINWDALTVKGTCQEVEKRYLRLTSAPDPNTVRPEEVLKKALAMVETTRKNYLYKCEQLKSIRQDLTVQRIRNELTVQVYETHARMALEAGDLPEYNQCQSQLKGLYAEGIRGRNKEFAAYNLLYIIFHNGSNRDLLSSMARLSVEDKQDKAVKHALAVRSAVAAGNYTSFFRLYRTAPNLGTCLMDLHIEKMRFEALRCMTRAYRPTLQVSYIGRILGFIGFGSENGDYKDQDDLEECEEWLRAHGAVLLNDNEAELCVECKASSGSLYMPEPEDAVAHGDANLALNDFFTQG